MKTPVTLTMLIVGGLLILAPFAFSALHEHQLSETFIARSDLTRINFGEEQPALGLVSRFGCWFTGTGLCVVAILGAVADARRSARELSHATDRI